MVKKKRRRDPDIWWREERQSWFADIPTLEGKRKRHNLGPDEDKARARLYHEMAKYYEAIGDEDSAAMIPEPKPNSPLLVKLILEFLRWNKVHRAQRTWDSYKDGLKYVTNELPGKFAEDITPADINAVKSSMIEKGLSHVTVNKMVTAVKRLFNWAVEENLLEQNSVKRVSKVSEHANAAVVSGGKSLSWEYALECIEICRRSQPLGDICEFLLLTGMRVGEVVRVSWNDIDFGQKMLRLERHKTSGHTNRPRNIPLADRAVEILQNQGAEDIEPDVPIFRGTNKQQFTVSALQCRLQRLKKQNSKLNDPGFSFHRLRHTCATYMARQGVDERIAQEVLGHSSTLMTRYYTHNAPTELVKAVNMLPSTAPDKSEN